MNLLAFDTSTDALSVALQCGDPLTHPARTVSAEGGARASACLIPTLLDLLAQAGLALRDLDAIVFGRGPGSFTGLRTACAVAQGLGFGSGVPVLGVDTLLAVAEDAHGQCGANRIVALLDARMSEVYWACYERQGAAWHPQGAMRLTAPEEVAVPAGWTLAGNALGTYGGRLPAAPPCVAAMPTAAAMLRLAPALIAAGQAGAAADAMPLYIRDKVAQTTQEREAMKTASPRTP